MSSRKPELITREGYRRVLSSDLLHPQQEYIFEALLHNEKYLPAYVLMRRKGQDKAAVGIGNVITTMYFEHNHIFTGVVIPERERTRQTKTEDLVSMLQGHYNYKIENTMPFFQEEVGKRKLPPGMKEGTPFPFKNSVGEFPGQIKTIIVPPYRELTDQLVDVPLGYGKEAQRYSLWIKYDAIFRILQHTFGEAVI